jgi:hypothetical protein
MPSGSNGKCEGHPVLDRQRLHRRGAGVPRRARGLMITLVAKHLLLRSDFGANGQVSKSDSSMRMSCD